MAHHFEDDIIDNRRGGCGQAGSPNSTYIKIDSLIKDCGTNLILDRIPISDIEKYIRKKKLDNIKS